MSLAIDAEALRALLGRLQYNADSLARSDEELRYVLDDVRRAWSTSMPSEVSRLVEESRRTSEQHQAALQQLILLLTAATDTLEQSDRQFNSLFDR